MTSAGDAAAGPAERAARRVCLVRLSAMGDVVQSLGAAQALLAERPELEVHFVTQATFAPLLAGIGFASVVAHDRRGGWPALRRTRRALREIGADVVIDLQGNWKSAAVSFVSGAAQRIGAVGPHRREPASALLLNRRVALEGPVHPAEIATRLVRRLSPGLVARRARLAASDPEVAAAAASVRAAGLDPGRPFAVYTVADPADNRAWPAAAMARQAALEGMPVLWLRGPAESAVAVPGDTAVLDHGPGSIRALVGLGVLVARVGGRVRGPDHGPVHVLNAAGAATAVCYGPQDPARTAPPGARVVVREDGPDCVPCRRRRCRHSEGPVCMEIVEAPPPGGTAPSTRR